MTAVIQRVLRSSVSVGGETIGEIQKGLLILLGAEPEDAEEDCRRLAEKISKLRIFSDENGKTNLDINSVGGEALVVSQFTLCADCSHGNRPGFAYACEPGRANELYELFKEECKKMISGKIACGSFGADMKVSLVNDGPFTIILRCRNGKILKNMDG